MRSIKHKHLAQIEKHLPCTAEEALSIAQLAKRMKCSYMTVKRRMAAWAERERRTIYSVPGRVGERGPESVCYYAE